MAHRTHDSSDFDMAAAIVRMIELEHDENTPRNRIHIIINKQFNTQYWSGARVWRALRENNALRPRQHRKTRRFATVYQLELLPAPAKSQAAE